MRSSTLLFSVPLVVFVVFLWFEQVTQSACCNDEAAHIPAGLSNLVTGRMEAYRVNPPLPRMIAALPLLVDRPIIDSVQLESPHLRSEILVADQWVRDNAQALPRYLLLARSSEVLFFVMGLWSIARWAKQLYGVTASWLAATMWAINPDVITNSAVVAPDLPAAASGLLMGYLYWNWLRQSQRRFPWSVAASAALAILCKFSWLFALLALPAITLTYDALSRRGSTASGANRGAGVVTGSCFWSTCRDAFRLVLSFSLTVLIINWCYGFEGTGTRLGNFEFISRSLAGPDLAPGAVGNRFAGGPLAWLPAPLPSEMIRGIDYLKWEFEEGYPCYLRGVWQPRGWWYFYVYALAVKMPLGYWALICGGLVSAIWQSCRTGPRYSLEWLPIVIAVIFIAQISSQTGFTHHIRYVLPAYGFLFLLASRVMAAAPQQVAIGLAAICLSGTIWFHATHPGLSHTFFNPAAGGPNNGWRHLSNSNVDWGQSTYRMAKWVKEHPEQRPVTVLFQAPLGHPEELISEFKDVATQVDWQPRAGDRAATPTPRRSGWYVISSFQMTLAQHRFFWNRTPVAQPYPDILVFFVDSDEIAL